MMTAQRGEPLDLRPRGLPFIEALHSNPLGPLRQPPSLRDTLHSTSSLASRPAAAGSGPLPVLLGRNAGTDSSAARHSQTQPPRRHLTAAPGGALLGWANS